MSNERDKPLRMIIAEMLSGQDMTDAAVESMLSLKQFPDIQSKAYRNHRLEIYAKLADKVINTITRYQMKDRWENDD